MKSEELIDEIKRHSPGVTGVASGYKVKDGKRTDIPCKTIFVRRKKPLHKLSKAEVIPREIDGEITDVQEAEFNALGVITPLPIFTRVTPPLLHPLSWPAPLPRHEWSPGADRTLCYRPAPGGVSCGHPNVTAGTLGGWVWFLGKKCILSNNHVLAAVNAGGKGIDPIVQPGMYDGAGPYESMATLLDFIEIKLDGSLNDVDAAIASVGWQYPPENPDPNEGEPYVDDRIADLTSQVSYRTDPVQGMPVIKSGRTTGITSSEIASIDLVCDVNYGAAGVARFKDQIWISTWGFIGGGDSGSWLLQNKEGEPDTMVGLCFAGSPSGQCVANPQAPVFELLGIELAVTKLTGVVTVSGLPVQGAKVLYYNLNNGFSAVVTTDINGVYEIDTASKGSTLLVSVHYESGGKVFSTGTHVILIHSPEQEHNFALSEYDAVANGQTVPFQFEGIGWLIQDLLLDEYKSVWY